MSLHTEWMRFKRECLAGRSKTEVSAARDMWYAGACAATNILIAQFQDYGGEPTKRSRCIGAINTEARVFRAAVMRRQK